MESQRSVSLLGLHSIVCHILTYSSAAEHCRDLKLILAQAKGLVRPGYLHVCANKVTQLETVIGLSSYSSHFRVNKIPN